MEIEALLRQFGEVAGPIIGALLWDRIRLLKENTTLQDEVRELYKGNLATLKDIADHLKKSPNNHKDG